MFLFRSTAHNSAARNSEFPLEGEEGLARHKVTLHRATGNMPTEMCCAVPTTLHRPSKNVNHPLLLSSLPAGDGYAASRIDKFHSRICGFNSTSPFPPLWEVRRKGRNLRGGSLPEIWQILGPHSAALPPQSRRCPAPFLCLPAISQWPTPSGTHRMSGWPQAPPCRLQEISNPLFNFQLSLVVAGFYILMVFQCDDLCA